MRRFAAIFLLGGFSLSLIAPALRADSDSKLPACCRRDGMHHCMTGASTAAGGTAIQAVCPVFSQTGATPAHSKNAVLRPAAIIAPMPVRAPARARILRRARIELTRSRHERAPPSLLS
ncbi:MAG TPA: hypothetical protein VKT49_24455 [Bryobacteraceae bacterium]|nr:hypothetical protein [Bryobacteraceae bacterium]